MRALAMHPEVMLFDEVTAALDPEMVREVLEVSLYLHLWWRRAEQKRRHRRSRREGTDYPKGRISARRAVRSDAAATGKDRRAQRRSVIPICISGEIPRGMRQRMTRSISTK